MEFKINNQLNWEDQFRTMKRWYYRARGERDIFGLNTSYQEDFFISFFITCDSFPEWLIKDEVATREEIEKYKKDNEDILKLCREIANFSKHAGLDDKKSHFDTETKIVGKKLLANPSSGPSYIISVLKVISPKRNLETYNVIDIIKKCLNIWGLFLLSKSKEIPVMVEEDYFANFSKWEPEN